MWYIHANYKHEVRSFGHKASVSSTSCLVASSMASVEDGQFSEDAVCGRSDLVQRHISREEGMHDYTYCSMKGAIVLQRLWNWEEGIIHG